MSDEIIEEKTPSPVTNPETKFSEGQEVKTAQGTGKIVSIEGGVYKVSLVAVKDFSEDELSDI